ncbi:MAG: hypothetical protein QM736_03125 [Vicinamibacterales bacterium]
MAKPLTQGRLGRLVLASALVLTAAACRQDMHDQPKYRGLRGSDFFADGQAARPLVANTVARGHLNDDTLLYTGKQGDEDANEFPFPVTDQVMARGQERFNIYCSPCHGRTGNGDGIIVRRGYHRPPILQRRNGSAPRRSDTSTTSSPTASAPCPTTRADPSRGSLGDRRLREGAAVAACRAARRHSAGGPRQA